MNRRIVLTSLALGVLLSGLSTAIRAEDNAVIKGKVIFKGDPEKYKRTTLDTAKDAQCAKSKPKIGSWSVIINKKSDPPVLKNVLVRVKEGLGDRKFEAPKEPVVLNQFGCEYDPHVIGIMEGQPLVVKNSDETNHNIHFLPKVNEEINFSQPKKDPDGKELKLKKEDVFKVKCDVHPWMGAHIGVYNHPFFSVTGEEGTFEIKNLPPGKYTLEAWHEEFGTQTATVEVSPGAPKEQNFTFEPK